MGTGTWMLIVIWINGVPPDLAALGMRETDSIARYKTEAKCQERKKNFDEEFKHNIDVIFSCVELKRKLK